MKKKVLTVLSLFLSLVLCLCACSSVKEIPSTKEEARAVATCGDYTVRYEELRCLTMNYKLELEERYGAGIFDGPEGAEYEEELRELVTNALIMSCGFATLCARHGIKLDDKTSKEQINEHVKQAITSCGSKEAYQKYLADNYMTDAVFRQNAAVAVCQERYYTLLSEEQERTAYDTVMAGEGFIRCRSIYIQNDPGEKVADNRADAEMVREALAGGASIEDYIGTKYNQDPSGCDYYFMRGYFLEEYEEAAFALSVGEISPVVETRDGFYIIQRVETDPGYFGAHVEDLMSQYFIATMENECNRIEETLSVSWNELGQSTVLWSMK